MISFLFMTIIPVCIFCQSVHLLTDMWAVPIFWLLWIMPLWTWVHKLPDWVLDFSFVRIYPASGIADHTVILSLTFQGTTKLSSMAARPHLHAHRKCRGTLISPHSCQHLLFAFFFFFYCSYPNGYEMVSQSGFDLHFSKD